MALKYKVWWPEQGQTEDDARIFEGYDHEYAAAAWADWYDNHSTDFAIVAGQEAVVQVLCENEVAPRSVLVTGQVSRTYSGRRMPPNTELGVT